MQFELSSKEVERAREFESGLDDVYCGAIGGRITYSFTPTSIGTIVKIKDSVTGKELDLTDYYTW